MIKQITPKNIRALLSASIVITSEVEVFSYKPQEKSVPDTAYLYSDCTNLVRNYADNLWELTRVATVSLYIVWPKSDPTRLDEVVVDGIIDVLNDYIISYACYWIDVIDDIRIVNIRYNSTSPMWYTEKNRPIRVVSYDIKYGAIQN